VALRIELGNSTTKELQHQQPENAPTILIPVGSLEQHGPHLPLDTDTRIAAVVARSVVDDLRQRTGGAGYLVAPAISYGSAGEHQDFAGTISIGTAALVTLLIEFGRSATEWAGRLVFVNGHGGNVEAIRAAIRQLRTEGRDAAWCPCVVPAADAHAGHTETSILLHISPTDVRTEEWCKGNTEPLVSLLPKLRLGGMAAVSEVGVLGDPTTATAADGQRIVEQMVTECRRRIERWAVEADGLLL
jgi:mycofactocin system creatininase family protein